MVRPPPVPSSIMLVSIHDLEKTNPLHAGSFTSRVWKTRGRCWAHKECSQALRIVLRGKFQEGVGNLWVKVAKAKSIKVCAILFKYRSDRHLNMSRYVSHTAAAQLQWIDSNMPQLNDLPDTHTHCSTDPFIRLIACPCHKHYLWASQGNEELHTDAIVHNSVSQHVQTSAHACILQEVQHADAAQTSPPAQK